jgi:HEAT repeat protein
MGSSGRYWLVAGLVMSYVGIAHPAGAQPSKGTDAALLASYIEALKDPQTKDELHNAIYGIAQMGPTAKGAAPALVAFVRTRPRSLFDIPPRKQAVEALEKIRASEALKALAVDSTWDRTGNGEVRSAVVRHLWYLEREKAVPVIVRVAQDTQAQAYVREEAFRKLGCPRGPGEYGVCDTPQVDALIALLKSPDAFTRAKAAKFVADESNDSDPFVVKRKWHAVRQKAIPALTELLKDPDPEVRKAAREGLGQLR